MRAIRSTGALSALCMAMAVAGANGQTETFTDAAVRSDDSALTALIRQGTEQSETFRTLVEQIGAMNGIVYVQNARCRYSVRACLLLKVVPAGPRRIMFVHARVADRRETIAAIAHELRHVTEVLEQNHIDSTGEMFLFYRHFASERQTDYFETAAARAVTESVRGELRKFEDK